MTDNEFDILWRLSYGTQPVHTKEAVIFKAVVGVNDGNYLSNREERYYRTGKHNECWCIKGE